MNEKPIGEIIRNAMENHVGGYDELHGAIGMLVMGLGLGWKPIRIIHSKQTIRKYENVLGIRIRDYMEEVGPLADKSHGWAFTKNQSNYWKCVEGANTVPNRRLYG
jgi:hypothetical protein